MKKTLIFLFLVLALCISELYGNNVQQYNQKYKLSKKRLILDNVNHTNIEYCQNISLATSLITTLNTTLTKIPYNFTMQFIQNTCKKQYMIPVNQIPQGYNYMIFEIYITSIMEKLFQPILLYRYNLMPYIYIDENNELAYDVDNIDYYGFYTKKSYQYIIISLSNISARSKLYFALYQYQAQQVIYEFSYDIVISYSSTKPCPRNCSGKGVCSNTGTCICGESLIDEDCSINAMGLKYSNYIDQVVYPSQWIYYYYSIQNNEDYDDINVLIKVNKANLSLIAAIQNGNITYPINYYNITKKIYVFQRETKLDSYAMGINNLHGDKVVIGLYNESPELIIASARLVIIDDDQKFDIENTIIYVVTTGTVALLAIAGFIKIMKSRARRIHQNAINNIQQNRELTQKISLQEIELYFPKKKFLEFSNTLEITCCSICLDDFKPNSICREILCEHIFHDKCIETWLENHQQNCPNCKREISRNEIVNWLNNTKKSKEDLSHKCTSNQSSPTSAGLTLINNTRKERYNLDIVEENPNSEILVEIKFDDGKKNEENESILDNVISPDSIAPPNILKHPSKFLEKK